jgi:hypothetical protein
MNLKSILALAFCTAAFGLQAQTTYNGNGNSAWGGAIGLGSLTLSDNGTTVSGSLTTGGNLGGNAFVLYLQTAAGGFSTTMGFNDSADQLRSAISQYTATGNGGGVGQSIQDFYTASFLPNYAIAMQPDNGINYGGLWQLANGGANSLSFISSVNLSPTGSDVLGTYNFSFNLADVGLTPGAGQSFELFGIQVSTSGYSSPEALGGTMTGSSGWGNIQQQTSFSTYNTTAIPEPSTMVLCSLSGLAAFFMVRRRR